MKNCIFGSSNRTRENKNRIRENKRNIKLADSERS